MGFLKSRRENEIIEIWGKIEIVDMDDTHCISWGVVGAEVRKLS